eukprot:7432773-Pyramimonas_sp.AAC.1
MIGSLSPALVPLHTTSSHLTLAVQQPPIEKDLRMGTRACPIFLPERGMTKHRGTSERSQATVQAPI